MHLPDTGMSGHYYAGNWSRLAPGALVRLQKRKCDEPVPQWTVAGTVRDVTATEVTVPVPGGTAYRLPDGSIWVGEVPTAYTFQRGAWSTSQRTKRPPSTRIATSLRPCGSKRT